MVRRIGQQRPGVTGLRDLPGVHDRDPVGEVADQGQVVRDQHHGEAEFVAQPHQQLDDLGLHRHVERGGRLVGDQQPRAAGERHRDEHALALAAGQLVRVAAQGALGDRPTSSSSSAGVRVPPREVSRLSWVPISTDGFSDDMASW